MSRAWLFTGLLHSPLLPSPIDPTAFCLLHSVLPHAELLISCLSANWIHLCHSWSLFSHALFSGHRRIVETVDHGKKRDRFVFNGEGAMKSLSSGTPFLYLNVLMACSSIHIKSIESTSNMVARRSMAFLTPCLEEGISQGWEIFWVAYATTTFRFYKLKTKI